MRHLLFLIVALCASGAGPSHAGSAGTRPLELRILSSRTLSGTAGDFTTVSAQIANKSRRAVGNITTYLTLVDDKAKMPVDLEDWSAEKGLFIGTIDAGSTFPLIWKIHFVQSGDYNLAIVADIEGDDAMTTSPIVRFKVLPKRNLDPGHVLPVALGEPLFLVFGLLALRYWRDVKRRHV